MKGKVNVQCPSNIAIVKYWGKKDIQLPLNPSLSFTLSESLTQTEVEFNVGDEMVDNVISSFQFDGKEEPSFIPKLDQFFNRVSSYFEFLSNLRLQIQTKNSFPHSSGIASSASSLGAMALILCEIERKMKGGKRDEDFFRKASEIARLGSGSACRSVYGGLALWGKTSSFKESSDEYAIPLDTIKHVNYRNFQDWILLIDKGKKPVSSSEGHELMKHHLFKNQRIAVAHKNLDQLVVSLQDGDVNAFGEVAEQEALMLHAMMMTSSNPYLLVKGATIDAIHRIREFRKDTGTPLFFTLDAGANIHLLFPESAINAVKPFVDSELIVFCEKEQYICDHVGNGPMIDSDD